MPNPRFFDQSRWETIFGDCRLSFKVPDRPHTNTMRTQSPFTAAARRQSGSSHSVSIRYGAGRDALFYPNSHCNPACKMTATNPICHRILWKPGLSSQALPNIGRRAMDPLSSFRLLGPRRPLSLSNHHWWQRWSSTFAHTPTNYHSPLSNFGTCMYGAIKIDTQSQ